MERWTNRVAIITGAGSGIGAASARLLAENGMRLALVDLELSRVQKVAGELNACKQGGAEVHALQCDVSKEEDVLRVVKWTRDNLGGADVIVNAAGVYFLFPLAEANTEKFRKMLDVNVLGVCLFNREVIKDMRDRNVDDGHLFNICSLSGQYIMEVEGLYPYAASKHSIRVLTEGMRRELRDLGTKIKITSISPGFVRTNLFAAIGLTPEVMDKTCSHILQPEDVANALLYSLGTPPHVQVHEITIRPVAEKK